MSKEKIQTFDLFAMSKEKYIIQKPIRLIEFFAGIGATHKALTVLSKKFNFIKFESWKICEWAISSIKAYNSIHLKDYTDYSQGKTREEMLKRINGVSSNYNEPISSKSLNKMPLNQIQDIYNNVIATHNLVNIMNVKGGDLEIVDTDKYDYVLTYSFPCQDLSL